MRRAFIIASFVLIMSVSGIIISEEGVNVQAADPFVEWARLLGDYTYIEVKIEDQYAEMGASGNEDRVDNRHKEIIDRLEIARQRMEVLIQNGHVNIEDFLPEESKRELLEELVNKLKEFSEKLEKYKRDYFEFTRDQSFDLEIERFFSVFNELYKPRLQALQRIQGGGITVRVPVGDLIEMKKSADENTEMESYEQTLARIEALAIESYCALWPSALEKIHKGCEITIVHCAEKRDDGCYHFVYTYRCKSGFHWNTYEDRGKLCSLDDLIYALEDLEDFLGLKRPY